MYTALRSTILPFHYITILQHTHRPTIFVDYQLAEDLICSHKNRQTSRVVPRKSFGTIYGP